MENNLYKFHNFGPMLLHEIKKPFNDKQYLFELKYDGIRALIFASPTKIVIQSRNATDLTNLYPELQSIKKIVKKECIFDGEIVLLENGVPSFLALQKRAHLKDQKKIEVQSKYDPVIFICFDILYESKNIIQFPLLERKKILKKYKDTEFFIKSKYILENGKKLFQFAKKNNLEGIVAKKKDSVYETNTRSKNWLKIKNVKEEFFYIIGYKKMQNNAISLFLAEKRKNSYLYVGKVLLYENNPSYSKIIHTKKKQYEVENANTFDFTLIDPIHQANVLFLERTKSGNLRHPVFKELKD